MPPLTCPPADPNRPDGMGWVLGAGMCDPRVGKTLQDRQPMAIIQSWAATSELWWKLGLRWHPELATKWLKGGGQFQVAEVVDEPPEELTIEMGAEQVLEMLAEAQPEYVETVKRIRDSGTAEQKAAALKGFEGQIKDIVKLAEYVKGSTP